MKLDRDRERLLQKQLLDPDQAEVERKLADRPNDPDLYYELGMSLFRSGEYPAADDAFSHGLALDPFEPWLRFGRGRCRSKMGKNWEALADFEYVCRLDTDNRAFRYYMATTEYDMGLYEEAAGDFRICVDLAEQSERYPLVTWLYLTYLLELKDPVKAKQALELVEDGVEARQMDYGYRRCVELFKGHIDPENFVDLEDMEKNCLKKPGRIELEQYMMYYGLYAYSVMIDDEAMGREALLTIMKRKPSPAFGYTLARKKAKELGLID